MNELPAKVQYEVVIDPNYKFEKLLGLYFFPPEAIYQEAVHVEELDEDDIDEQEIPELLLTTVADKGSVRYFVTTLYEVYDSTNYGAMFIALGDGVAWGIAEIDFPKVFSDVVEVLANNEIEAADRIGEALDLPNFDIHEPNPFGKVPAIGHS